MPLTLATIEDTEAGTNDSGCVSATSEFADEKQDDLVTPRSNRPFKYTPMSTVSKQFDLDGKGYLDETELTLRRMDSQNLGHLTNDKVYVIMESLQREQKQTANLLTTLQRQQRQMIQMKHGIFALAVFAILLALSNVGTSFAAAKLAREVEVSSGNGDLVDMSSGLRVGVTPKIPNMEMQPLSSDRRRHLLVLEVTLCRLMMGSTTDGSCSITGTLSYSDMEAFHKLFCDNWDPNVTGLNGCTGSGVDKIRLTCNGRISDITDHGLNSHGPIVDTNHPEYPTKEIVVFPHPGQGYQGTQYIFPLPGSGLPQAAACTQSFVVGMYCDKANTNECLVLAAHAPGTQACFGDQYVKLCGDPVTFG